MRPGGPARRARQLPCSAADICDARTGADSGLDPHVGPVLVARGEVAVSTGHDAAGSAAAQPQSWAFVKYAPAASGSVG
jgi:hypothetical protein